MPDMRRARILLLLVSTALIFAPHYAKASGRHAKGADMAGTAPDKLYMQLKEDLPRLTGEGCLYRMFDYSPESITPIWQERKFANFTELPHEYDIWNSDINPYNVSMVDTEDTIFIDVSSYIAPSQKYVTSEFGFRKWRHHNGIDLKVHRGDTVRCAFDGIVRITRYDRHGYGYFTVVRHSNGLETLYGHMSKFIAAVGDTLKAGDPIGLGGSTGRSTGYHLHLEFRYLGTPINPNDIVDFSTHKVKNSVLMLTASNFDYIKEIEKIRYWTVRPGDTLSHIAYRTGVSISKLCALNGIKRNAILRIGKRIRYT